jgi:hypothetical protein
MTRCLIDSAGTSAGVYANDPARFVSDYSNLDPSLKDATGNPTWRMSGMYSQTQCPNAASVGQVWKAIIDRTGGVHADLCGCPTGQQAVCNQALKTFFDSVAKSVTTEAAVIGCRWILPPSPSGQTLDPDKVNLEFMDPTRDRKVIPNVASAAACDSQRGGWYYENLSQPSNVSVCPASCDAVKASPQGLIAAFGCATIHL